ncbi:exophilin-5 isoform X2 [Ambystoma mexicanum]|uniref:exophilin-5 isoform X2 n=1 Tax=Ambystoma mexicanum TaxID=8296 RepID=UPI0037E9A5B0
MTKDTSRLDLSFLNEEEASAILGVLERDQQLRRKDRDRVSKLQNAKRDIKWLQGATGEWFEEIQRKKFRNDTDVSSMLKQPLTHRLKKKERNEPADLKMSRSNSQPSQGSSSSSLLGLRSPLASLFSFRKLRKQALKPPPQQRHTFPILGHTPSQRIDEHGKQAEVYGPPLQNPHYGGPFATKEERTGVGHAPPADSPLERELFLVLGELEKTLGQEHTESCMFDGTSSYTSKGQFRSGYSYERRHNSASGGRTGFSEGSATFLPDGTRTLKPNDEYKTHSTYRPHRFYDMYSNRHRTAPKHGYFQKQTSNESPPMSPVSGCRSFSSATPFGSFSVNSLNFPFLRHSSFGFLQRGQHKESRRTPLSDIVWSPPSPISPVDNSAIVSRAQSLMDLSNINHHSCPKPRKQNRMYELYCSQQNLYDGTAPKVTHFGKDFPRKEETKQESIHISESEHCHHAVSGTTPPSDAETFCQDIVPMQTEDTCDVENKENCPDSDQYDSDATIHSSDTMSDPDMEVLEASLDEHQAIASTFTVPEEPPSIKRCPSPAAELTPKHEYSSGSAIRSVEHGSPRSSEFPSLHRDSSFPVARLASQPRDSAAEVSGLSHMYGFSSSVPALPPEHVFSSSAVPELPPEHGYSSSATNKLSPQHNFPSVVVSEFTHQQGCSSSDTSGLPHHQKGCSSSAAPELPSQHGYSSSDTSDLPLQKGCSTSAAPELPSQHGYSSSYTSDLPHQKGCSTSAAPELPSQHGYSSSDTSDLPHQKGCSTSAAPELPSQHGYSSSDTSDLPHQKGCSTSAAPELSSQHGYSSSAPAELPPRYGYSFSYASELPHKNGYSSSTTYGQPPQHVHSSSAVPELPPHQGYSSSAAHELPPQHGYSSSEAHELPPQPGHFSSAAHELPPLHGYASSEAHELPPQPGHFSSTARELPPQHGYLPFAASELPHQQGFLSSPAPELPPQNVYSSVPDLSAQPGRSFPFPASLNADHKPSLVAHEFPLKRVSFYSAVAARLHSKYANHSLASDLHSQQVHPSPANLSSQQVHPSPADLPSQQWNSPLTNHPSQHGYAGSASHELLSQHEYSREDNGLPSQHSFCPPVVSASGAMDITCDLRTPTLENTAADPSQGDSPSINYSTYNTGHALSHSSPSALVGHKENFFNTSHSVDYRHQAEPTAQPRTAEGTVCPEVFQHQPRLPSTDMNHEKNVKTINLIHKCNIPSTTNTHDADKLQAISNMHHKYNKHLRSATHHGEINHSTFNANSAEVSSQTSGPENSFFSNCSVITQRVSTSSGSLIPRNQTKPIALQEHPNGLTSRTDGFKHEVLLPNPQETINETKLKDEIYQKCDYGGINPSNSQPNSHGVSRKTIHSQNSIDKSNATLHGSLPDISYANSGLDLAHSELLDMNADWLTSKSKSIAPKAAGRRSRRYSSILLHAYSLPNLDLLQSVLQRSPENPDLTLDNLRQTISDSHDNLKVQIQGNPTPSRSRLIDDVTANLSQVRGQDNEDNHSKDQVCETLETHRVVSVPDDELSKGSVLSPQEIFPGRNYYCASRETPNASSLNERSTDTLEVNQKTYTFISGATKGSSDDSAKQRALNHDSSGDRSWAPNYQNGYTTASSRVMRCSPFPVCRDSDSWTDSAFTSGFYAETSEDHTTEKPTSISDLTPSFGHSDIRDRSEGTFILSDLAAGVFNGAQKPNYSEDQSSSTSHNLSFILKTQHTELETDSVSSNCNTERQMEEGENSQRKDLHPMCLEPGYSNASVNSEWKSAVDKILNSSLPGGSCRLFSDVTYHTSNNSLAPDKEYLCDPPIGNNLEIPPTNNGNFPDSFLSEYELPQRKSERETSVGSQNTNMPVPATSDQTWHPGKRVLSDHLQAYISGQRAASPSSNHKTKSRVFVEEQPPTMLTSSCFYGNKDHTVGKGGSAQQSDVNVNSALTKTVESYQVDPPDISAMATTETQPATDLPLHLSKVDFFPSSDGLEEAKTVHEYKTSSTLSLVTATKRIEYHELFSVYYSLPIKHSKPLSEIPMSTDKNILSPSSILNKKQEFHIDLANPTFPISRLLSRRMSTDSLLSNISIEENAKGTNSNARHTPVRSSSWDESEQTVQSPNSIYSIKNVLSKLPWHADHNILSDETACQPSFNYQNSNTLRSSPAQVPGGAADIRDHEKYPFMPTTREKRDVFHPSPSLISSSSLSFEKHKDFLQNFSGSINNTSQQQKVDLENRKEINPKNEDYNQNILQENSNNIIDNTCQSRKNEDTAKHGLGHSQMNIDERVFSNWSDLEDKHTPGLAGVPHHPFSSWLEESKAQNVTLPGSEKVNSRNLSLADLQATTLQPLFDPQHGTIGNDATVDSRGLQKTKRGQLSPRNQPCTEFSGLHSNAMPFEDSHNRHIEDQVLDNSCEQPVSHNLTNTNRLIFDYTTGKSCDEVKSNNEPVSTIDWQQIYKLANRRYSDQGTKRQSPPSGILRRGSSDSTVQLNKQKILSPSISPLHSLEETLNDNQASSFSYNNDWTSVQKLKERNVQVEASRKPVPPFRNVKETRHTNACTQKINSYRTKCPRSDPTNTLNYTKSSFLSKSFPEETARLRNTPRLSATFESPEEIIDSKLTASDWPTNHRRQVYGHESPLLPFAMDNYQFPSSNNLQDNALPEQNIFEWERRSWEEDDHVHRSKSLKNLNLHGGQSGFTGTRGRFDRRFSATTNVDKAYGRHPSSPTFSSAMKYARKFHSQSELMSSDENDNWHSHSFGTAAYRPTRSYSTSPTVGFGIFGKEQQLAFLENIKRSLTEGRLWRPCYLKNPGFLTREAENPLESSAFRGSSFDGSTITVQGMPPRQTLNIYRDDPVLYSESDTDTTTDDEYYLDEFDKESEL